ncbi:MAG: DUF433 domain-containing protein, partial [Planctomycetia bacterium]|nr:DUF433 domain-containing protein [Planctomycetia bacterium]
MIRRLSRRHCSGESAMRRRSDVACCWCADRNCCAVAGSNIRTCCQGKECPMNWRDHIVSDPEILVGKPVVKGTRLSVDLILDRLADGWTSEDLYQS